MDSFVVTKPSVAFVIIRMKTNPMFKSTIIFICSRAKENLVLEKIYFYFCYLKIIVSLSML